MNAKILKLIRGQSYTFNISNREFGRNIFLITTDEDGGTKTGSGEITNGVVNTWVLESGEEWTGEYNYRENGDVYTLAIFSETNSQQLDKSKLVFTPNSSHPDTLYFQSLNNKYVGGQITLIDAAGSLLNSEELRYLCGLRQTNRIYPFNPYVPFVTNFLTESFPASVRSFFFNDAPIISGLFANTEFADGGDTILISGLISDPENDILSYLWSNVSPLISLTTSGSLVSDIDDPTSLTTSVTLTTPTVDTLYKFMQAVSDSDNTATGILSVPVSGTYSFTSWGDTDFVLGDCGLPYSYLL